VVSLSSDLKEVDAASKKFDVSQLAARCIGVIAGSLADDGVVRAGIALLETDFFDSVAADFVRLILEHFVPTEFATFLLQSLLAHYPAALTAEVLGELAKIGVEVSPTRLGARSLVNQLSDPSQTAALYSNPALPYEVAAAQVVASLRAAEASGISESLPPILLYFRGRAPPDLIRHCANSVFLTGSPFSADLNRALREYGSGIASFFEGLPETNPAILEWLEGRELPGERVFPVVLSKARKTGDLGDLLTFLPIRKLRFDVVADRVKAIRETGDFTVDSDEAKAALILWTVEQISTVSDLPISVVSVLFDFPSLLCIAPILKNIRNHVTVVAAFETAKEDQIRLKTNILNYIWAVAAKTEDALQFLPSIFLALLSKELSHQATAVLRAFPLKDKEVKGVLTFLLRQKQTLKTDERSLRSVFESAAQRPKSRDLFDALWSRVVTAAGCRDFWRLTHDCGIVTRIVSFPSDPICSSFFPEVIEKFNTPVLREWAFNSSNPLLVRCVLPYLGADRLGPILSLVSAYPHFFSDAFASYFLKLDIAARDLEPFLLKTQTGPLQISRDPPQSLPSPLSKLEAEAVVSPAALVLRLLPRSRISGIDALLPTFFALLSSPVSPGLVFSAISICLPTAWSSIVARFSEIVDAVARSASSHVHSDALRLVQTLAERSPDGVAAHASALFAAISGPTLFADDSANLVKIKQLLSAVLPVLARSGAAGAVLDQFASQLDNFSVDRASQLLVHAVTALGDNGHSVFLSLLRGGRRSFALLLADQLPGRVLLSVLLRLVETDSSSADFIFELQLPPCPEELLTLFSALSQSADISGFLERTCASFSLSDFISFAALLIPSKIAASDVIRARIAADPSPAFTALLPALLETIPTSLPILSDVLLILPATESPRALLASRSVLSRLDTFTLPQKVQALGLLASVVERFELRVVEIFPDVVTFAADFFALVIRENVTPVIPPTTASICLLLKASPGFCSAHLPGLWSSLLSPFVYTGELRPLVETAFLGTAGALDLEATLRAFVDCFLAHPSDADALALLFRTLSRALRDAELALDVERRIVKLFVLAFAGRCDTWEQTARAQGEIITAFAVFIGALGDESAAAALARFGELFAQLTELGKPGFVESRRVFVRAVSALARGGRKAVEKFISVWIQTIVQFLEETDDGEEMDRELTREGLALFAEIGGERNALDREEFPRTIRAVLRHAREVKEGTETFLEKVIGGIGPAVAAMLEAVKDEALWRLADGELIELMRDKDPRVRIAGLKIVDEAFRTLGAELTVILPEIVPSLAELAEDENGSVDAVARETIANIQTSIGEEIAPYFR
jgi:hypothetical protein